jgi:hypothetical protein
MNRIWEILEECKLCETVPQIQQILARNDTPALREVLLCAYHPNAKWYFTDFPQGYRKQDTLPGVSHMNLYTEVKKLYMFSVGNPTADALTQDRRHVLLVNLLEGLENEEAQLVIDIFKGDLQIDGLNKDTINQVFPGLIS